MLKGKNQKGGYSIVLALFWGMLFIPVTTTAFSVNIDSHGMCEYSELPEVFDNTPPPDRRVYEPGEIPCTWLMLSNLGQNDKFEIKTEWYQPDGTIRMPFTGRVRLSYYNSELTGLLSMCLLKSGEDGIEGIPNISGEWTARVRQMTPSRQDLHTESFTVIGSGGVTTTTIGNFDCPPGYPVDCQNGYCCPSEYPVCGYGSNEGECFGSGGLCPISLIYGTDSAATELLRFLRDNVLSKSQEGQELIKLYYQWSPIIVKAMEADEEFKQEVKEIVNEVIALIE